MQFYKVLKCLDFNIFLNTIKIENFACSTFAGKVVTIVNGNDSRWEKTFAHSIMMCSIVQKFA